MGTFNAMTPEQKERAFAEDVLGWKPDIEGYFIAEDGEPLFCMPLKILDHAMMGVEKLQKKYRQFALFIGLSNDGTDTWHARFWKNLPDHHEFHAEADTPNEAIVEACLRIKSPHLFKED